MDLNTLTEKLQFSRKFVGEIEKIQERTVQQDATLEVDERSEAWVLALDATNKINEKMRASSTLRGKEEAFACEIAKLILYLQSGKMTDRMQTADLLQLEYTDQLWAFVIGYMQAIQETGATDVWPFSEIHNERLLVVV